MVGCMDGVWRGYGSAIPLTRCLRQIREKAQTQDNNEEKKFQSRKLVMFGVWIRMHKSCLKIAQSSLRRGLSKLVPYISSLLICTSQGFHWTFGSQTLPLARVCTYIRVVVGALPPSTTRILRPQFHFPHISHVCMYTCLIALLWIACETRYIAYALLSRYKILGSNIHEISRHFKAEEFNESCRALALK